MDKEYKSPVAAMLWSFALPGFGQLYNRDYFIGVILLIIEFSTNLFSHLNLSILHTFHAELKNAHDVVNFEHGLFYPSIWAYSMWQAYNRAQTINGKCSKVYFTGLFFGLVAGMNIGLFAHHLLVSPIYSGLSIGIAGALLGHLTEKIIL